MTVAKSSTLRRFFRGLLLILFGALLIRSPFVLLSPLVVAIGVIIAAKSFGRLARIFAREQLLRGSRNLHENFARETLARKVFWLLLAIAEVDGRAEAREFDMVRRFLMERFVDPVTAEDLRSWTAQRIPTDQIEPLTQRLRFILSHAECETVFFWCCLVAFADGQFNPDEHLVLQKVAHAFGSLQTTLGASSTTPNSGTWSRSWEPGGVEPGAARWIRETSGPGPSSSWAWVRVPPGTKSARVTGSW